MGRHADSLRRRSKPGPKNTLAVDLMLRRALDTCLDDRETARHVGHGSMLGQCATARVSAEDEQLVCRSAVTDDDVQVSIAVHVSKGDRVRGSAAAREVLIGKGAISVADQQLVWRVVVTDDDVKYPSPFVSQGDLFCVSAAAGEVLIGKAAISVADQRLRPLLRCRRRRQSVRRRSRLRRRSRMCTLPPGF